MIVTPLHYSDILNDQAIEADAEGATERAAALRAGAEALEAEDVRQRNGRYAEPPVGYRAPLSEIPPCDGSDAPPESWAAVDLRQYVDGEAVPLEPTVLVCED